jgi:TPR repeat protein
MYENGLGVDVDYQKAILLYNMAIDNNVAPGLSYNNLGYFYYYGRGVKKDYEKAFELFKKSVEFGGPSGAYYALATMYDAGEGVAYDGDQAAYWYEKALREGEAFARNQLRDHPATGTLAFRRALQSRLQRAGVYDGPIDGSFGPMSQAAVDRIFGQY